MRGADGRARVDAREAHAERGGERDVRAAQARRGLLKVLLHAGRRQAQAVARTTLVQGVVGQQEGGDGDGGPSVRQLERRRVEELAEHKDAPSQEGAPIVYGTHQGATSGDRGVREHAALAVEGGASAFGRRAP